MHESESRELVSCAACGAEISSTAERSFAFGSGGVLCWDCSMSRGGRYDALHERWEVEPRVADLFDSEA